MLFDLVAFWGRGAVECSVTYKLFSINDVGAIDFTKLVVIMVASWNLATAVTVHAPGSSDGAGCLATRASTASVTYEKTLCF